MTEEARAARNAYMREYRKRNREKVRAYNRAWRAKNPDKMREYNVRHWEKIAAEKANEDLQT